jgi:hypothetical protein
MPPRKAPRLGGHRSNPVNLSGFIPLVDLQGDPQFFPFGATVDERHRSMRATRNWWRNAVDAIRRTFTLPTATRRFLARISLGLPQNHPSRAWKQAVPRPPRVQVPDDHPSWSVPGGLGRSMRARNWWRMAVDAIRRTFTLPGADRRRVARISLGLPHCTSLCDCLSVWRWRPQLSVQASRPLRASVQCALASQPVACV